MSACQCVNSQRHMPKCTEPYWRADCEVQVIAQYGAFGTCHSGAQGLSGGGSPNGEGAVRAGCRHKQSLESSSRERPYVISCSSRKSSRRRCSRWQLRRQRHTVPACAVYSMHGEEREAPQAQSLGCRLGVLWRRGLGNGVFRHHAGQQPYSPFHCAVLAVAESLRDASERSGAPQPPGGCASAPLAGPRPALCVSRRRAGFCAEELLRCVAVFAGARLRSPWQARSGQGEGGARVGGDWRGTERGHRRPAAEESAECSSSRGCSRQLPVGAGRARLPTGAQNQHAQREQAVQDGRDAAPQLTAR